MERSNVLMQAAKVFLIAYLGDGKIRQPEDFDKDILGQDVLATCADILASRGPVWNDTIFAAALGEMVGDGLVIATQDENGWHYYLPPTQFK